MKISRTTYPVAHTLQLHHAPFIFQISDADLGFTLQSDHTSVHIHFAGLAAVPRTTPAEPSSHLAILAIPDATPSIPVGGSCILRAGGEGVRLPRYRHPSYAQLGSALSAPQHAAASDAPHTTARGSTAVAPLMTGSAPVYAQRPLPGRKLGIVSSPCDIAPGQSGRPSHSYGGSASSLYSMECCRSFYGWCTISLHGT